MIGCNAGFLSAARIKGSHAAIKRGMLCAEAAFEAVVADRSSDELSVFPEGFKKSPLMGEFMTGVERWFLLKVGVSPPLAAA
jgi:electron-transferring-flavoprotein dehydrogenase